MRAQMDNQLANPLMCFVIRGGFEIWADAEKAKKLQIILKEAKQSHFVMWEGNQFNTADVVGIFTVEVMEERNRRRNGQWQCKEAWWHDRGEKCNCSTAEERERNHAVNRAIEECEKCQKTGFVQGETGMRRCECNVHFFTKNTKL